MRRVKQVRSALQFLQGCGEPHHAVVVTGDFNCDARSCAISSYMAFGQVLPGVMEWGFEVTKKATAVPPHGYTDGFRGTHEFAAEGDFTFARSGQRTLFLDHMWFTFCSLDLRLLRTAFAGDDDRDRVLKCGLPCDVNMSDHLPIGAVFLWRAPVEKLANLAQDGIAEKQNRNKKKAASASSIDAEIASLDKDIASLIEACPFQSASEREEFQLVLAPPFPGLKGKPSESQISAMRNLRERKSRLLASADGICVDVMTRIFALQRARKKLEKKKRKIV